MTSQQLVVALPKGDTAITLDVERAENAWAMMPIAHGAGAGMNHAFLVGFAEGMRAQGVSTARFNFPYSEAGRRMPGPAAHAIATWRAVVDELASEPVLWAAGKSYGGRMASMAVADGMSVAGLVYLGYPLHQPGKPEAPRAEHLPAITVPQLFIEGTKDAFVLPHSQLEEIVSALPSATISWIEGGGHSFEVAGKKRGADEVGADLAPLVAALMRQHTS
ncbi:alpha/beta family hydrolase [Microbacterium sp. NC79]|uniref:alpha/beta hydrolase family protein n=1 Tax=Microbacterium sp. NC79 TaxID=2851009 RepID=UPI001C2CB2CF|nr:alpha/beta family hydrolase [Microbacterium sp. NC79]MBV0894518.1 dienelactone hydrolase [Microbacterium sp. NC79]